MQKRGIKMRFLLDSMLGKLTTWLRVTGYDSYYQSRYKSGEIDRLVNEGRCLLTRNKELSNIYRDAIWIFNEHTKDQLHELKEKLQLEFDPSAWFTRCLRCNTVLKKAPPEKFIGNVPDYICHQHSTCISYCPSCGRFFWPGTHRKNMITQLKTWGIV